MGLKVSELYNFEQGNRVEFPLFISKIKAGFPSPADDYVEKRLDLNDYLIKHPASTFFVRVEGESMVDAAINSGDILIVDRAIEPQNNKIVIAVVNGELTVKRIHKSRAGLFLVPDNSDFAPMEITAEMDFQIWGVVTYVIHEAC